MMVETEKYKFIIPHACTYTKSLLYYSMYDYFKLAVYILIV